MRAEFLDVFLTPSEKLDKSDLFVALFGALRNSSQNDEEKSIFHSRTICPVICSTSLFTNPMVLFSFGQFSFQQSQKHDNLEF